LSAGNLVSKDFPVRSFSAIELRGVGNIFLTQGDTESVRIVTDTTTFSTVELENEGNKLTITSTADFSWRKRSEMSIYITVNHLKSVRFTDGGAVTCTNELKTDTLDFSMESMGRASVLLHCKLLNVNYTGVGWFDAKGKTNKLIINATGVGTVQLGDLLSDEADVWLSGVANVEVYASKSIKVKANGLGKVIYKGYPQKIDIQKNIIGSVEAQ
jgi:Putative auto-transporter adhesin, head GIN domain